VVEHTLLWRDEEEYMNAWVWECSDGWFVLRVNGQRFPTRDGAVAAMRRSDAEAGILWPWNEEQS